MSVVDGLLLWTDLMLTVTAVAVFVGWRGSGMTTPITRLIDASVVCLRCGAQGMGSCGCYERCGRQGCARLVSTTDDVCRNPLHSEAPRDVACPHCGAEPGRPCHLPDGTPLAWAHARRKAASESVRRFTPT